MYDRFKMLHSEVDKLTVSELNFEVKNIIKNSQKKIIANHNLHSIYLISVDPDLYEFWEKAYLTHIDGMPLIWWGKILGYPLSVDNRITYLDWIKPLLNIANQYNWRIFYLGGKPGIAKEASTKLNKLYPNITFQERSGYFNMEINSEENCQIVNDINEFKPHILMVGMGMPRQEKWILNNFEHVSANVVLNSGACFDYIAGVQKTPPRIVGKLGFEWLYRLMSNPKRLSRRYLVEPVSLAPLFLNDLIKRYFTKSKDPS